MATLLQVEARGRGWGPAHDELRGKYETHPYPGESLTPHEARIRLLEVIEPDYPGQYYIEPKVDVLRAAAFAKIDARTDELIAAGFEFEEHVYSCSLEAQIRMTNMMMAAEAFPYPYSVSSLDDKTAGMLESPAHMRAWCSAALVFVSTTVGMGAALKESIRAIDSEEELLAFEDPRPAPSNVVREPKLAGGGS